MLCFRQHAYRCMSTTTTPTPSTPTPTAKTTTTTLKDRRPIFARSWSLSRAATSALVKRNVHPNSISMASIGFGAITLACFAGTGHVSHEFATALWLTGGTFIQARLVANMLDGMVANEIKANEATRVVDGNQQSWIKDDALGGVFNEVPDRLTDTLTLMGLGLACGNISLGLAASLAAMATAYIRSMGAMYGARQHFEGIMSKPRRMFFATAVAAACAVFPEHGVMASEAALSLIFVGALFTCFQRLKLIAVDLRQNNKKP